MQLLLSEVGRARARAAGMVVAGLVSCRGLALVSIPVTGLMGWRRRGVCCLLRVVSPWSAGGVWWVLVGFERLVVS